MHNRANIITCHHTALDLPGSSIAFIIFSPHGAGTSEVTITASADGIALAPITTTLTVYQHGKLVPLGGKVSAPGKSTVRIKVGVKNVGPGPVLWPTAPANQAPLAMAYLNFPEHTPGVAPGGQCAPWNPQKYPELWGWLDRYGGSYKFACSGTTLQPGQSYWYEFDMFVTPQHLVVTGYITLRDEDHSPDQAAPITIDTRAETLPVTGVPVHEAITAAAVIILAGVLLLAAARLVRRTASR